VKGTVSPEAMPDLAAAQGYCVPPCAEDVIGMTFYRLMLTDMASFNAVDVIQSLLYHLLGMANPFNPPLVRPV
jgi:hypothetical protein